jgi:hypothetical protein
VKCPPPPPPRATVAFVGSFWPYGPLRPPWCPSTSTPRFALRLRSLWCLLDPPCAVCPPAPLSTPPRILRCPCCLLGCLLFSGALEYLIRAPLPALCPKQLALAAVLTMTSQNLLPPTPGSEGFPSEKRKSHFALRPRALRSSQRQCGYPSVALRSAHSTQVAQYRVAAVMCVSVKAINFFWSCCFLFHIQIQM